MRSAVIAVALIVLVAGACCAEGSYVSVWGAESTASQSTSSWYGNVGLIVTPTAYTPPASATAIGGHWIDRDPDATWVATVNFGLTDDLEVGGAYVELPNASSEAIVNLKYHLNVAKWLGEPNLPEMAVGSFDVADQINRSIYMVFSKGFPVDSAKADSPRINLHAGWGVSETSGGALDGFFGGVEFNALKYGLVQAEYDGDAFNVDFRYSLTPSVSLEIGLLDGDAGGGATYRSQF
jgi:hypothetical protein